MFKCVMAQNTKSQIRQKTIYENILFETKYNNNVNT